MRINKLDLLRYGRFTGVSLGFPAANPDIHIVFGPNEAGKSTSLAAIEDLLFGIPHNSSYNFIHDYANMRVGGVLQHEADLLEVRRRKGNKDTLLGPDEMPLHSGESALTKFLGGADKTFFTRMFSLNHERLARGGREILEAKDEVGEMLFSAGSGVAGLHDQIATLAKEADCLWGPRKAAHRKYYTASDALEEAERDLRSYTITASKWQETKQTFDASQVAYEGLEKDIESLSAEQRKLSRIRRVYKTVHKLSELTQERAALGDVKVLPEDSNIRLETATEAESNAGVRIEELVAQLDHVKAERADLPCDDIILLRADDIQQLHKQRIEVQKERADLPKRRAELEAAEVLLRNLAGELGWGNKDTDSILSRIPQRAKVIAARALLTARGERASEIKSATATMAEAQAEVREMQHGLSELESALDVSALTAVINATRELGDIGSKIKAAEKEVKDAAAAIARRLKPLRPRVASEQVLTEMPVLPRTAVQDHRDCVRELEQEAKSCNERIRSTEREIAQRQKSYDRLVRDEAVVPLEELARAREVRNEGWALIRRHYIDGNAASEEELEAFKATSTDVPEAYESKVALADSLVDGRFEKAQAAGEMAAITRQIEDQNHALNALHEEKMVLDQRADALNAAWRQLWAEAPFDPLAPDHMLIWLESRAELLECIERRNLASGQLECLQQEEHEARARIVDELTALDEEVGSLVGQPFRAVVEAGTNVQKRHEKRADSKAALQARNSRLKADKVRKKAALEKAEAAWHEWQGQWSNALIGLELEETAAPEAVADQLDTIETMRATAKDIDHLRHDRIDKIERDIDGFAASVAELVGKVANDLAGSEPDDAVAALESRLDRALRIHNQQMDKDKAIVSLEERITVCQESGRDAKQILRELQGLAGVTEIGELRDAIANSERKRDLDANQRQIKEALAHEGDGLPLSELQSECAAVDLDEVAAREETLRTELGDLRNRLTQAAEQRAHARQAFEAIGGDHRAAHAAAARQEAIASMRDVAEQYVRVRTAGTLLAWAIDRYRLGKQAPLLKRSGQIFSTLTSNSFCDLRVEYDEQDYAHLAGVRPDESAVDVGGMSDGTADQLYLALRLAAVDEYLNRAHALPFVADDLFVNFDDTRAGAGFQVLAEIGRKTQVLFFTHHGHLVEIARATLGDSVNIVSLGEEEKSAAA